MLGDAESGFARSDIIMRHGPEIIAPEDRSLRICFEIETCDDAEVVAAAAEGEIEIWARLLVYIG